MHLCTDSFTPEVLDKAMGILFTSAAIPAPAADEARPLFTFGEEKVHEHRRSLPTFDEWVIVPEGHAAPRQPVGRGGEGGRDFGTGQGGGLW